MTLALSSVRAARGKLIKVPQDRLGAVGALRLAVLALVLSLDSGEALAAGGLRTMAEVGAALRRCSGAPASARPYATLSFSFRRDGRLLGPPQVAAIRVPGDAAARRRFAEAAVAALERCIPLRLAPALGGDIAGQVFTMQVFGPDRR
jgi:hypothetical protein